MPPKKTKPNEKCPCGSGKKHKKCCMVAAMVAASSAPPPPTATAVLDEVMEALTLNITATNNTAAAAVAAAASDDSSGPSCCHGSTSDHFPDGRAYSDLITGILAVQNDGKKKIIKFQVDNTVYLNDLNFIRYILALCTSWYLKTKTTNDDMKVLLLTAAVHKYSYDSEKMKRYSRAFNQKDDRGVINYLSRETKSFCDCMQAKKMEAKGMAKRELCSGCRITFPRKDMLICGCKVAMYCNEDCQTKDWTRHRGDCRFFRTKPSGKNDQNN